MCKYVDASIQRLAAHLDINAVVPRNDQALECVRVALERVELHGCEEGRVPVASRVARRPTRSTD